ncbi:IS481 family transposase [Streptomyces sp. Tu 3180]|nr:IS481 family transposase [Streptomyces sp. Tu 3180]
MTKASGCGVEELSRNRSVSQETFVSHADAAPTPRARLRLARLMVDEGWPVARAAERYDVSWPAAKRWADRYAEAGPAAMTDRPSRPHRSPTRTIRPLVRKIVHLRWKQRLEPVQTAGRPGMPASTVHPVLTRCRINRLSRIDRATGEPVRRPEHPHPGAVLPIDVEKPGNVPDGGGWRCVGRVQGRRNRAATPGKPRNKYRGPVLATAFVHTVVDDHSRVAYAGIRDDETAGTAVDVLHRAVAWFAARGVRAERVLTDNGSAHRSRHWNRACTELGITPKKTRPYRPQTNGKVERFHRTLADGWALGRFSPSGSARRKALPAVSRAAPPPAPAPPPGRGWCSRCG